MKSAEPEETEIQIRTEGDRSNPVLIYLPGLHGDWTLLTAFATLAREKFFLVEITYPRTLSWSLDQYAEAVSRSLHGAGIANGWILAESFSSQIAWAWLKRIQEATDHFQAAGIIIAGGFVKYPARWTVRAVGLFFDVTPWFVWKLLFAVYLAYSGFRHRHARGHGNPARDFLARRTPLDIEAMRERLRLIVGADPRPVVARADCPIYLLAGAIDPVVPIWPVLRWLRKNCPMFKGYRIIWPADHTVLATEPVKSLKQIDEWILQATGKQSTLG